VAKTKICFPKNINKRVWFSNDLVTLSVQDSAFYMFLFLFEAATQLARRVQPKRTQVVCNNKVGRSRLAQRHSRNGHRTYKYSFDVYVHIYIFWNRHLHTQTYKQARKKTKHKWSVTEWFWIGINVRFDVFYCLCWLLTSYFVFSNVSI